MSLVRFRPEAPIKYADLAHLVERHLAKVEVASSSLVIRSRKIRRGNIHGVFVLYEYFLSGRGTTRKRKSESKRQDNALGSLVGVCGESLTLVHFCHNVLVIIIDSKLPIVLFAG